MVAILQTAFLSAFPWMKTFEFWKNFTEIYSAVSYSQHGNIGSDNDLAPARRHAIVWTNDG